MVTTRSFNDSLYKGHRKAVDPAAKFVHADLADIDLLKRTLQDKPGRGPSSIWQQIRWSANRWSTPAKYYQNNLIASLGLLGAMQQSGVSRIVFSSTAAHTANRQNNPSKKRIRQIPPTPTARQSSHSSMPFDGTNSLTASGTLRFGISTQAGASDVVANGTIRSPT